MIKAIESSTKIRLTIKDMIGLVIMVSSVVAMYFALKSDIDEAKKLPPPIMTQKEFEIRNQMMESNMQQVKQDVSEIKESVKIIEERLYEIR
jgi:hypothetical protein